MANVEALRQQRWREVVVYGRPPENKEERGWLLDIQLSPTRLDAVRRWQTLQFRLACARAMAEYNGVPGH
jgi:hypothetical protein